MDGDRDGLFLFFRFVSPRFKEPHVFPLRGGCQQRSSLCLKPGIQPTHRSRNGVGRAAMCPVASLSPLRPCAAPGRAHGPGWCCEDPPPLRQDLRSCSTRASGQRSIRALSPASETRRRRRAPSRLAPTPDRRRIKLSLFSSRVLQSPACVAIPLLRQSQVPWRWRHFLLERWTFDIGDGVRLVTVGVCKNQCRGRHDR